MSCNRFGQVLSVVFAAFLSVAFTAEARLTARFTFDDIGRSGANMLKASVGQDITVKVNPANEVSGLGDCYVVGDADPAMADECLKFGSHAIAVPKRTYLAVPHGLAAGPKVPFCMVWRSYFPLEDGVAIPTYNSLYSFHPNNGADGFVFLRDKTIGGGGGAWTKGYATMKCGDGSAVTNTRMQVYNGWHTWVLSQSESGTRLFFDGTEVNDGKVMDLTAMPYIYLTADDNGEDTLTYVDWIEIYDETEPAAVFGEREPVERQWEGLVTRSVEEVTCDTDPSGQLQYVFTADASFTPAYALAGELRYCDAGGNLLKTEDIALAPNEPGTVEIGRYTRIVLACNPVPQRAPKAVAALAEKGATYAIFDFRLQNPGDEQTSADLYFGCAEGMDDPPLSAVAPGLVAGGTWRQTVSGLVSGNTYTYAFVCSNATEEAFVSRGTFTVSRFISSVDLERLGVAVSRPGMLGGTTLGGCLHTDAVLNPAMTSGPEAALANSFGTLREGVPLTKQATAYAYRANIYLRAADTLHFAGMFYDWTDVILNDHLVQWGSGVPGQSYSTIGRSGDLTVSADGWYDLRLRFGAPSGGVGAMWQVDANRLPLVPAFGYNINGATTTSPADYAYPEDAGDGEFLRVATDDAFVRVSAFDLSETGLSVSLAFAAPLEHAVRVTVCCDDVDHGDRTNSWPTACVLDGGLVAAGVSETTVTVPHTRMSSGVLRVRVHHEDGDMPWAERLVAWTDPVGYSPDVSSSKPALAIRNAGLSDSRDGAKVEYSLYWPGAGCEVADVYAVWGSSPDALTETKLVAEGSIGPGQAELTGIPAGETVYVAFYARNAAGYESDRSSTVAVTMPTASMIEAFITAVSMRRHVEVTATLTAVGAGQTALLLLAKKQGEADARVVASRFVSDPGEHTVVWEGAQDNAEWGATYEFQIVASNYSASAGTAWLRETLTQSLELYDGETYTWSGKVAGDWNDPTSWTPIDATLDHAGYPIGKYARAAFPNGTKAVVRVDGQERFALLDLSSGNLDLTFVGSGKMDVAGSVFVGSDSRVEFSGVTVALPSSRAGEFSVYGNSNLTLSNGAVARAGVFKFPDTGSGTGTVSVVGCARMEGGDYVEVDGGMTLVVSNATVKGNVFWFGDRSAGGHTIFCGESPRLEVTDIKGGWNAPCEFVFNVPEAGYAATPVVAQEVKPVATTYEVVVRRPLSDFFGPRLQTLLSIERGMPLASMPIRMLAGWGAASYVMSGELAGRDEWCKLEAWPEETNPKRLGLCIRKGMVLSVR